MSWGRGYTGPVCVCRGGEIDRKIGREGERERESDGSVRRSGNMSERENKTICNEKREERNTKYIFRGREKQREKER